jgi:RimJ/RimL family protein N-acetyltransferase
MPANLWITPKTLEGNVVRLEPLSLAHIRGLSSAGKDETIWKYMVYGDLSTFVNMEKWVNQLLQEQAAGTDLPFSVILKNSGTIIGATRYLEMRPIHRSLEIGGTWYAPENQRTAVNPECKYLLLKYAFETLGCIRVQFKVDQRNTHSLHAIERLGAIREGVLRNHMILPDGTVRDSVFYSILNREWPKVKIRLEDRLKN